MDIEKEMRMVQEQMFSDKLLNTFLAAYMQEQEAHGTEEEEQEYQTAKEALVSILSRE